MDTDGMVKAIGDYWPIIAGLVAGAWGVFVWMSRRARIRVRAILDGSGQVMRVMIMNKGRAEGVVSECKVLRKEQVFMPPAVIEDIEFPSREGGRFAPLTFPPDSDCRLTIRAKTNAAFSQRHRLRVRVRYGSGRLATTRVRETLGRFESTEDYEPRQKSTAA